jgi:hypothetical protein
MTGTIPSELGKLARLADTELELQGNHIGGTVPAAVCTRRSTKPLNLTIDCDLIQCTCESGCACGAS